MIYGLLANVVLVLHLLFVLFVGLGGLLACRWGSVAWIHLPAAIWGAVISLFGWTCPLTPLENWLRRRAGQEGYEAGFIEHYLLPLLYPEQLTMSLSIAMGIGVIAINATIYGILWRRSS